MAQRNSSGRGGTATTRRRTGGRQTSASDLAELRVDEIRARLRAHGVSGVSRLRKPELVQALVKAERRGGAGKRSTGPSGRAAAGGRRSAPARAASTTSTRAGQGRAERKARATAKPTRAATRTGRASSRSVSSSQRIESIADRPERPGRSLVTANHDVIQRWARARGAKPATITGTERDGRVGVLTFDLPGYRESRRLRQITWNDWFRTFDERRLNLIYQEQLRDGRPSNFFRTESPDREDA
ncbi:hypothetical protein [Micromonospora sp. NBRC 101691]|uniref:hypothetical protein n=1 Tax=Micromonospora TaxID=1873 RepID=UPI0024A57292|nr:hypothetical protein [Micromonospora sp. NBRC 101691]GLY23556.1 hypothetical protein Misp04_32880 [Micromonospora sp. NBRC 101691]